MIRTSRLIKCGYSFSKIENAISHPSSVSKPCDKDSADAVEEADQIMTRSYDTDYLAYKRMMQPSEFSIAET